MTGLLEAARDVMKDLGMWYLEIGKQYSGGVSASGYYGVTQDSCIWCWISVAGDKYEVRIKVGVHNMLDDKEFDLADPACLEHLKGYIADCIRKYV